MAAGHDKHDKQEQCSARTNTPPVQIIAESLDLLWELVQSTLLFECWEE